MERYICIHGHFYQPPRENPWLGTVEEQASAYPYHDWNERITDECYGPNANSPILAEGDRILKRVNNYAQMSFNFGPTLLSWMEECRPEVYQAVLEADRLSMDRFSGHGSAIAQVYNHMIMPLANRRDKYTQALWGRKDFEGRFGRPAEGMWLPETAVDIETLEVLAELGIKFTILAPHQVRRIKKIGDGDWEEIRSERVDPTMAYLCPLPSGRSITVFVYIAPIAREVAFGDALNNGELLAKKLIGAFDDQSARPQLVHIATDGESYGHHRRFGDMALAYCCFSIESRNMARLTNYGEYLERYPPTHFIDIVENSSWSCSHGLGRWRENCGCRTGANPAWIQRWRRPLRDAMDWLGERLGGIYEEEAAIYLKEPWAARDGYIEVISNRSSGQLDRFLQKHVRRELSFGESQRVSKLLEMQKNALLMYTSCGWFFDEISGIETVQVMRYAARAIDLAEEVKGLSLEAEYVKMLERAPSNVYDHGAKVYELLVKPARASASSFGRRESAFFKSEERAIRRRGAGVLLHITSLPSPYGIGDLGPWAYRFADFLSEARQSFWQVLPLNPTWTSHGNSPYDSYSAFAGNPLMISPEMLVKDGFLLQSDLAEMPPFSSGRVHYVAATDYKTGLLERAFDRCQTRLPREEAFERFCHEHSGWLEDCTLFLALKTRFKGVVWSDWPQAIRDREKAAIEGWRAKLKEQMLKEKFVQYLFFKQWSALRRYCNDRKISIIGDLPIYVSYDSAEVWATPEIFKLDAKKRPTVVAGVPPDYFSATGQRWGNPVFHWEALKATGYAWWIARMRHNLRFFDWVRLDHFRGFVAYWEIPANETTAIKGQWVKAPAEDFFRRLVKEFPRLPIIAEDLGLITPDVREVMDRFGFPGMKVLLFAFDEDLPRQSHAPHNYDRNCVVYTGTHDNNTVAGWFKAESDVGVRERLFAYFARKVSEEVIHWELVRLGLMSVADTAIVPMQDLLGLGEEARMNRPATRQGNWEWRLVPEHLTPSLASRLAEMTELYGRV